MKYLFYTISDLNSTNLACTDILYKSLKNKIKNLNFQIIVPKKYSNQNINNNLIKYVDSDYLSISRYNKEIFEQDYDYFIYLDSDIYFNFSQDLFFDEINNSDIVICEEKQSIKLFPWHHIKMDDSFIQKNINKPAVNSGFFCFTKEVAIKCSNYISNSFKDIYNLPNYKKHDKAFRREILGVVAHMKDAKRYQELKNKIIEFMSEQSLFNKFLIEDTAKYKIKDFSHKIYMNKFWLNAGKDIDFLIEDNMIYHFCGHFNLDMGKKLYLMKKFIEDNKL